MLIGGSESQAESLLPLVPCELCEVISQELEPLRGAPENVLRIRAGNISEIPSFQGFVQIRVELYEIA